MPNELTGRIRGSGLPKAAVVEQPSKLQKVIRSPGEGSERLLNPLTKVMIDIFNVIFRALSIHISSGKAYAVQRPHRDLAGCKLLMNR